ncbi:MAG: TMEM165/GDT1 family protein, partial [Actinobacteria bacterium]|nr:TMEM165/GDT1 family protein [Actinomycetota bacterium]
RFKRPVPIILGILVATLINHGLAGALGTWITTQLSPQILRWVLGLSFLGMAVWTLIPDKIEDEETRVAQRWGVFGATLITFFLAEMGDKTQIATVAMSAHYQAPLMVVIGTTLGMLIALGQESYIAIPARVAIRLQGEGYTECPRRHKATVDETDTTTIIEAFQQDPALGAVRG